MNEILDKNNVRAKEEYEKFVLSHKNGNFMQSLHWTGVKKTGIMKQLFQEMMTAISGEQHLYL